MNWQKTAKDRMVELNITQEDLITVLGVKTRGAVGHYLCGRRQPSPEQLKALASALDLSLDELMSTVEIDNGNQQVKKTDQRLSPLATQAISALSGLPDCEIAKVLPLIESLLENHLNKK